VKTPANRLGSFLDRLCRWEARLDKWYGTVRDSTADNRVALLTYYLSRHSRRLPRLLGELSPPASEALRQMPCAAGAALDLTKSFPLLSTPAGKVTGRELLAAAMDYQDRLRGVFRALSKAATDRQGAAILGELAVQEERDLVRMKKMMATDYF
jgi:hypothetical protein